MAATTAPAAITTAAVIPLNLVPGAAKTSRAPSVRKGKISPIVMRYKNRSELLAVSCRQLRRGSGHHSRRLRAQAAFTQRHRPAAAEAAKAGNNATRSASGVPSSQ